MLVVHQRALAWALATWRVARTELHRQSLGFECGLLSRIAQAFDSWLAAASSATDGGDGGDGDGGDGGDGEGGDAGGIGDDGVDDAAATGVATGAANDGFAAYSRRGSMGSYQLAVDSEAETAGVEVAATARRAAKGDEGRGLPAKGGNARAEADESADENSAKGIQLWTSSMATGAMQRKLLQHGLVHAHPPVVVATPDTAPLPGTLARRRKVPFARLAELASVRLHSRCSACVETRRSADEAAALVATQSRTPPMRPLAFGSPRFPYAPSPSAAPPPPASAPRLSTPLASHSTLLPTSLTAASAGGGAARRALGQPLWRLQPPVGGPRVLLRPGSVSPKSKGGGGPGGGGAAPPPMSYEGRYTVRVTIAFLLFVLRDALQSVGDLAGASRIYWCTTLEFSI